MARYNFGTFGLDNRMVGDFEKVEDQMYRPPPPMHNEGIQTLVNTYAPPTDIDTQAAKQVARAAKTDLPAQKLANQQANAFNQLLVNAGVIAPPESTDPVPEDPTPEDPPTQEPPMYDPVYPEEPVYGVPDDYYYNLDDRTRDELINMPPVITPSTPNIPYSTTTYPIEDFLPVNPIPADANWGTPTVAPFTPTVAPMRVESFSNPTPVTSLVTNPYTGINTLLPDINLNTRPHNYSNGGLVNPVAYSNLDSKAGGFNLPPTPKERLNNLMYALEGVGTAKANPYSPAIDRGLDVASRMGIEDSQGLLSLIGGANNAVNRFVSGAVGTVIPGGRRPIKDLRERRRANKARQQAVIEENIEGLTNTGRRDS